MKLAYAVHDSLPPAVRNIRQTVFVQEQGFLNEFDETDHNARHILAVDTENRNMPVACCRIFPGKADGEYVIGRIAVVKDCRGKGIGMEILNFTEKMLRKEGVSRVSLSSQVTARGFYEAAGYRQVSDEYLDEACPHVRMEKKL